MLPREIIIRKNQLGNGSGFIITRTDGSTTDISYNINNIQKTNDKADFINALRQVIKTQIFRYKTAVFKDRDTIFCAVTGKSITKNDAGNILRGV